MQKLTSNRSRISHKDIIKKYLSGESSTKISKIAGISAVGVIRILKFNNIDRRNKKESEFLKRKYNYDEIANDYKSGMHLIDVSHKHKTTSSNILEILKKYGINSRGIEGRRKGENHYNWKGGKTHDIDGYIIDKNGRTHRVSMEEKIGRKLFSWESVHHIDGDKKNYKIDNLVIMFGREHARFHTFLRQARLEINIENLKKFCKKESDIIYRFTVTNFKESCIKIGYKVSAINLRGKSFCRIRGCNGANAGYRYCSKHYQRMIAKKKGYWKSSKGRISKFIGKFKKEKVNNRP